MSNRIPSSLMWLIDKRARLDGEIKKTRASINKMHELVQELSNIELDLAAIDRALNLHKLTVDTELIKPISSQYKTNKLPYGDLSRAILKCLEHVQGTPMSTADIATSVSARYDQLGAVPQDYQQLYLSVRYRLKSLANDGVIERYFFQLNKKKVHWRLVQPKVD